MSDRPMTRRRMLAYSVGTGAGLFLISSFVDHSAAPPYPSLVLPPGVPSLMAQRINNLHLRYGAIRTVGGVSAVRQRIISDLHGYRGFDEWLESVQNWIRFAGWADAADLLVDSAEIGGASVRRNAAALLAAIPSGLPMANGYAPRIVRLHKMETDPAASADWRDLRRQLGI
jgi:hypothetical protein